MADGQHPGRPPRAGRRPPAGRLRGAGRQRPGGAGGTSSPPGSNPAGATGGPGGPGGPGWGPGGATGGPGWGPGGGSGGASRPPGSNPGGPPGGPGWWRKFRALPRGAQALAWLALAGLVILVSVLAGQGSGNTPVAGPTPAPAPAEPHSPPPEAAPAPPSPDVVSPTPELTLEQWREVHNTDVVLVIASANGLATAIANADGTQIEISCDALHNNYRRLLQPLPNPPEPETQTMESARDAIYNAQRECTDGVLRRRNLATARESAAEGAALLHRVAGPAG